MDLNIENGKIFVGDDLIQAGLSVENGKIVVIGQEDSLPEAPETIDASNRVIIPGGIDVHTHVLDLNFFYREDFVTGTQAAASGGITTILEMPLGIEGKTALESFDDQLSAMKEKCLVDFGLIGAAGYNNIDSIQELAHRGVIGFKTFLMDPPDELAELKIISAKNDYFLTCILSEIAKTGLVSSVHAEDDSIVTNEIERLTSMGELDFRAHTESRPTIAEEEACKRAIVLANSTNTKLNLVHMSSKNAFGYIRDAKKRGWDVTCEITPHHLFLTWEGGEKIGSWAKVDPPLRSKDHLTAAWTALNDGTIDIIASDHSPYSHDEKDLGLKDNNLFECGSGCPGLETMLPLMLDAVNKKKTVLKTLVRAVSTNPAKRFGIYPRKGAIAVNADADLVIVNMQEEYVLKSENMFTKAKITVFDGRKVMGKVEKTLVRGNVVYDSGEFHVERGFGEFITPLKPTS